MKVSAKEKILLQGFLRSLLQEAPDENTMYALEQIIPTLLPAVVALLKIYDENESKMQSEQELMRPINFLASFLFRNNPKCGKARPCIKLYGEVIQQLVEEEKRRAHQVAYLESLRYSARLTIEKLLPQDKTEICNSGTELIDILKQIERLSGLVGLADEVQVVLQVLDIRKTGLTTYSDLVLIISQWIALKSHGDEKNADERFRDWLQELIEERLSQAISEYMELSDISQIDTKIEPKWHAVLDFMYDIKQIALKWDAFDAEDLDPETVMDGWETKVNDDTDCPKVKQVVLDFTQQLANARMVAFAL